MNRYVDHFLLGLLWLLSAALAANFWFTLRFGFDLFNAAHWMYLGDVQTARQSVSPAFYISMVAAALVALVGLYFIMRPRRRKIRLIPDDVVMPQPATTLPTAPTAHAAPPAPARPPRLDISKITPPPPVVSAPIPTAASAAMANFDDIFTHNGFTVKTPPRIAGLTPALFAIGPGETLWIGAADIESERMAAATQKLNAVFADTLEDVAIKVNAFVVNPKTPVGDGMLAFDSAEDLREYVTAHAADPLTDDERDNFEAYSEYIDTVASYLGKL